MTNATDFDAGGVCRWRLLEPREISVAEDGEDLDIVQEPQLPELLVVPITSTVAKHVVEVRKLRVLQRSSIEQLLGVLAKHLVEMLLEIDDELTLLTPPFRLDLVRQGLGNLLV